MRSSATSLLRLYPRAWRERYGEEFLAVVGERSLSLQETIDVLAGAIDARLSSDVQGAVGAGTNPGGTTMLNTLMACERRSLRATRRDSILGAAVMVGASLALTVLGVVARRGGSSVLAEILLGVAFPVALMLSMPFWLTKGQSWKAQAVFVGGTTAFLLAIGWLATRI